MSKTRLRTVILAIALTAAAIPAALGVHYEYPVEGGTLQFDTKTGAITGCGLDVQAVYIPEEINGVAVRSIGDFAFTSRKHLIEVHIPDTVTSIGHHAFEYCEKLESVKIPDSVTKIEAGAFCGCTNLKSIDVPGSVKEIPDSFCWNAAGLETLKLSEGTESISSYAFNGCDTLETAIIPDSVTEIGMIAFSGKRLKTVVIGSGIKKLDQWAFLDCTSLESVFMNTPEPPSSGFAPFRSAAKGFTIYFPENASGSWLSSTWHGYPVKPYNEDMLPNHDGVPDGTTAVPDTSAGSTGSVTDTSTINAVPSDAQVLINGKPTSLDAFKIFGNNYFKLRDLAYALSGTQAQFNVEWDKETKTIFLVSGSSYVSVGGELKKDQQSGQSAIPTPSGIYLDGKEVKLTSYSIGGNNYFKLRDIGRLFDFGVGWEGTRVLIDTSKHYTE